MLCPLDESIETQDLIHSGTTMGPQAKRHLDGVLLVGR